MFDIDSNAYRVLKKLNKVEDSFGFSEDDSYWFSYLAKRDFVKSSQKRIEPNNSWSVRIITKQGESFIKDHRKKTLITVMTVVGIIAAIIAAVTGVIAIF